jgi:LPXTG-motif cell wall-anchored protein
LDGVVNSFDYSTVDTNFGKSFPSMGGGAANLSIAAVPEPSTFVLGGLGLLGLAGLKLRRKKA